MENQIRGTFILCLMFAFLLTLGFAQAKYGVIEGKVADAEGTPLPGVTIQVSSPDLIGGAQVKITDQNGRFRFPALLPGMYMVEASLEGFIPAKRGNVRLFVGQTITVDLVLEIGKLEEEITVVGEAPLVDVKDSQVNVTNLDDEIIRNIVSATKGRSSTSGILNLAPNVQDSSAAGAPSRVSNQWQIDGNVVSYIGSGADWTYPDVNMIEEAQVGGFGASAEYGGFTGAMFNTILKSGGNNFEGMAEFVYSGLGWRNENIDISDNKFSLYTEPPRELSLQVHFGIGGPILKDKLWFYAGGGQRQDDTELQGFDKRASSQLPNGALKLTYQMNKNNRFHALFWAEQFLVLNRGFSVHRAPEFAYKDIGPDFTLTLSNLHTFSDKTFSELKVAYFWCIYDKLPNQGRDVSEHYDAQTGAYTGNYGWWSESNTGHLSVSGNLSHHADDFIQGSHDFKFGVEFLTGYDNYAGGYPGGYNYVDNVYTYYDQQFHNYAYSYELNLQSTAWKMIAFAQDSWSITDRLTINPGIRYGHRRGTLPNKSSSAIFTPKGTISPRIGFTWDIFGDHTTAFKAHYGRFYDALKTRYFDSADVGIEDWVMYEVMPDGSKAEVYRYVYTNPTNVDPDIKMPHTDQFTLGLERTFMRDLAGGVSFIYREYGNFIAKINTAATWGEIPFTFKDENGVVQTIQVYDKTSPSSADQYLITNPKAGMSEGVIIDPKNKYTGFSLFLNKRFSNGWMAHAAYSYGEAKGNHSNTYTGGSSGGSYYLNPNSQINAYGHLPNDPTHVIDVYGTFLLPLDFSFSPRFHYQTGNNWTRYIPALVSGRPSVYLDPRGSNRVPPQIDLSFRLEKYLRFTERMRLGLIADVFNAFNQGVERSVVSRVDNINFGKADSVNDGRSYRISVRFYF
ncbi:MAG TPA: TonB-dependent receptor [Acidobacteriota bacterium]|nr:TonB-dependent receptor [Acidobacteriota bacterium]